MGGRKEKNTSAPVVLPLTEADINLQNIASQFAGLQLSTFGGLGDFQRQLTQEGLQGATGLSGERVANDPFVQAVQQAELQRIQGGGASQQQLDLIRGQAQAATQQAGNDINTFAQGQRDALARDLTPSLGLRPTDTPIQDRGFQIGTEATRQFGQASSAIQGQAFNTALNLPFQASQANQGLLGLQAGLQNQDFQNRLALAGGAADFGLGLAAPSPISNTVAAVKAPKSAGNVSKGFSNGGGLFGG